MKLKRFQFFVFPLLFLVALAATSCDIINPSEELPAYIRIDSIAFIDSITGDPVRKENQVITDAWVIFNGEFHGVYELPANFPVLAEGLQEVIISPGIIVNGIRATRTAYPFFKSPSFEVDLQGTLETRVEVETTYEDDIHYLLNEDFEDPALEWEAGVRSEVTFSRSGNEVFEGSWAGEALWNDGGPELLMELQTVELLKIPGAGRPVYLEMNYKNDLDLQVGLLVYVNQSLTEDRFKLNLVPQNDWNKVYIPLASDVGTQAPGTEYRLKLRALRTGNEGNYAVYLDNLRLIN